MKYALPCNWNLHIFLLILPVTLAHDPRISSLQRRDPEPVITLAPSLDVPVFPASTSDSSAAMSKMPADQQAGKVAVSLRDYGPAPFKGQTSDSARAPTTSIHDEQPGTAFDESSGVPYPVRVQNPTLGISGLPYVVGVIILPLKTNELVFLIKDTHNAHDGWRFPETDWGPEDESAQQAVAREAWETPGLLVDADQVEYVGQLEPTVNPRPGTEKHYFKVRMADVRREKFPRAARFEVRWFTYDQAAQALATHHAEELGMLKEAMDADADKKGGEK